MYLWAPKCDTVVNLEAMQIYIYGCLLAKKREQQIRRQWLFFGFHLACYMRATKDNNNNVSNKKQTVLMVYNGRFFLHSSYLALFPHLLVSYCSSQFCSGATMKCSVCVGGISFLYPNGTEGILRSGTSQNHPIYESSETYTTYQFMKMQ